MIITHWRLCDLCNLIDMPTTEMQRSVNTDRCIFFAAKTTGGAGACPGCQSHQCRFPAARDWTRYGCCHRTFCRGGRCCCTIARACDRRGRCVQCEHESGGHEPVAGVVVRPHQDTIRASCRGTLHHAPGPHQSRCSSYSWLKVIRYSEAPTCDLLQLCARDRLEQTCNAGL